MNSKIILAGLFTLIGCWSAQQTWAQSSDTKKKVKISVKVTEDGKTTETTKEVELNEGDNVEELLEDLDILKDMDLTEDGEKMEIRIHKSAKGKNDRYIILDIDDDDADQNYFEFTEKAWQSTTVTGDRPMLGVYVETVHGAHSNNESVHKGARITKIIENSGAEKAGLKSGDIITSINGAPVSGHNELVELIQKNKVGDELELEMVRDGKEVTQKVTLGKTQYLKDYRVWVSPSNKGWEDELEDRFEEFEYNIEELGEGLEKLGESFEGWSEDKVEELQERWLKRSKKHIFEIEEQQNRAFLGITLSGVTVNGGDDGVLIGSVVPGSTAEEMGLQEGDVIKKLNKESIDDFDDLVDELKDTKVGDKVKVTFERDGKKESAEANIKSRKSTPRDWPTSFNVVRGNSTDREVSIAITVEDVSDEDLEEMAEKTEVELTPTPQNEGISVEFYPNPNNGNFTLQFEVPNGGDVVIRIVDAIGREIYNEKLQGFSGMYSEKIDLGEEPNGVYFLTVEHSGSRFTKKVVIK